MSNFELKDNKGVNFSKHVQYKNKLIQAEIVEMKRGIKTLREFLQNCHNTINSETRKLEKLCSQKIRQLEMDNLETRRRLSQAKEENNILVKNTSELNSVISQLQKVIQEMKLEKFEIQSKVNSLESKLKIQCKQCSSMEKELEERRLKCFEMENKLASNKAYMHEEKQLLCEMLEDQKNLKMGYSDLQFQLIEKQAYEDALQEHVSQLEEICTTLRDQLDEQQQYFLQKEIITKKEATDQYNLVANESKRLSNELKKNAVKLEETSASLIEESSNCSKLKEKIFEKDEKIKELETLVNELKENIKIEKSTVDMLSKKNNDLALQLAHVQSKIRHIQDEFGENVMNNNHSVDRKALKEIENTVQQYFDDQKRMKDKFNNSILADNMKKVTEYQDLLREERKKRLSAEIQVENLRVELEKARVESAVQRSHLSSRKTRRTKSRLLPHFTAILNTTNDASFIAMESDKEESWLKASSPVPKTGEFREKKGETIGHRKSSSEVLLHGVSDASSNNLCNTKSDGDGDAQPAVQITEVHSRGPSSIADDDACNHINC